jgi:hypothetical protein
MPQFMKIVSGPAYQEDVYMEQMDNAAAWVTAVIRDFRHSPENTLQNPANGFAGYGCGLCQTGVPCESKVPGEHDV